jgi:hypothetical protein
VLPDGSVVFSAIDRPSGAPRFWVVSRGSADAVPLLAPSGHGGHPPLVSAERASVAWLVRHDAGSFQVLLSEIGADASTLFSHNLLADTTPTLLDLNMATHELIFARDLDEIASVQLDGVVNWGPVSAANVAAQPDTVRRIDGQWLRWDAYREEGPYLLRWSTRHGDGGHQMPLGRSITAAALDPAGEYVAASTTTSLNIGSIDDAVFVLRTRDGTPVWRKAIGRYTRSQVAFLGTDYFVFSDVETTGRSDRPLTGRVRAFRLPGRAEP